MVTTPAGRRGPAHGGLTGAQFLALALGMRRRDRPGVFAESRGALPDSGRSAVLDSRPIRGDRRLRVCALSSSSSPGCSLRPGSRVGMRPGALRRSCCCSTSSSSCGCRAAGTQSIDLTSESDRIRDVVNRSRQAGRSRPGATRGGHGITPATGSGVTHMSVAGYSSGNTYGNLTAAVTRVPAATRSSSML